MVRAVGLKLNLKRKVKPSFVEQRSVVELGLVVVYVPDPLVRKTIRQSKAEWLQASLVNLSAMAVLKVIARRS